MYDRLLLRGLDVRGFVVLDLWRAAAALLRARTVGVVDQNLAHRPGRDGEKMGAVLPLRIGLVGQAQISLIDQRGRLQGVIRAFSRHIMMRETPQIFVNEGRELIERAPVSVPRIGQQLGYFLRGGGRHRDELSSSFFTLRFFLSESSEKISESNDHFGRHFLFMGLKGKL